MKIEIVQIIDRGVKNKERLHLRVTASTDLSYYVVFGTSYTNPQGNSIYTIPQHAYWFPPTPVKAGDNIILFTCSGTSSQTGTILTGITHFFYWGLPNTVWNKPGDCAVLFEVNSWQTSKYE